MRKKDCSIRSLLPQHFVFIFFTTILFGAFSPAKAQTMLATDHFNIYYSPSAQETARRVAEIAEEVFTPLTSAFNAYDNISRIHIIVHDNTDFSNGFAIYYQNKVEIWASDLEFELRGTTNWLKNVLTHELAHIVSLKVASRGMFNLGITSFGRYNVNPDYNFTLPFYHLVTPSWYAEGVAQFATKQIGHDDWDSHRDMLLRMATIENDLLNYDQMGVFASDGLHREMVYNQGFSLLNYVKETYGEGKVEALTHNTGILSFNNAIEDVLGLSSGQLYDQWRTSLRRQYGAKVKEIVEGANAIEKGETAAFWPVYQKNSTAHRPSAFSSQSVEGQMIVDAGYLDYFPAFSPDGQSIAYISNEDYDFSLTNLKIYNKLTGEVKQLRDRVRSRVSWLPDGKRLLYTRNKGRYNDLFIYDLTEEKEKRISKNLRAKDPSVSPDGKTVVFARNNDGSTNLALVNIDGTNVRYLTNYDNGTQVYAPKWSPDGKKLLFSIFRGEDRDIAMVQADGFTYSKKADAPDSLAFADSSAITVLINSAADERDPEWLPDGSGFLFSSDRGGVFNIYEYTFENAKTIKRTAVLGGAFSPTIAPDGSSFVYAGYHAANYNLYHLNRAYFAAPIEMDKNDRDYLSIYDGKPLKELHTPRGASSRLSLLQAMPVINFSPNFIGDRFTINTINVGLQFAVGDLIGSNYFQGYGLVGRAIDQDLDLNYTFSGRYQRRLPPLLTEDRTLAPTGFIFGNRRVINDFDDMTETFQDTVTTDILVISGGQLDTLENVFIDFDIRFRGGDEMQFDFKTWGAGLNLPLSPTQQFDFVYMHREYGWSVFRDVTQSDNTRFFQNGTELIFNGYPFEDQVRASLFDTDFFSSNDLYFSWTYSSFKPTADAMINPTGGRLLRLGYGRLNTMVTDSLIFVEQNGGVPGPSNVPALSEFPLNQFSFDWYEFLELPIRRHTLSSETHAIYHGKRFLEGDELTNFNGYWPLREYLGGFNTLRGYPYFTLSGNTTIFNRIKYTLPVIPDIGKQFFHMYFDRLYASVFYGTGSAWNENKLTAEKIGDNEWLHDFGVELRLSTFNFYRIPGTIYAIAAWPMRGVPDLGIKKYDERFYFGLVLGGSY